MAYHSRQARQAPNAWRSSGASPSRTSYSPINSGDNGMGIMQPQPTMATHAQPAAEAPNAGSRAENHQSILGNTPRHQRTNHRGHRGPPHPPAYHPPLQAQMNMNMVQVAWYQALQLHQQTLHNQAAYPQALPNQAVYPQALQTQVAYPQAIHTQAAYPGAIHTQAAYPQALHTPTAYSHAVQSQAPRQFQLPQTSEQRPALRLAQASALNATPTLATATTSVATTARATAPALYTTPAPVLTAFVPVPGLMPQPPQRISPLIRIHMRNATAMKTVVQEYPLDHLYAHSARVRRQFEHIKSQNIFELPTTNSLEPDTIGFEVVLRWLKDFPAAFSTKFYGKPQITLARASPYFPDGHEIRYTDNLRIIEAVTRLELLGPLCRQFTFKSQLLKEMADTPLPPDDFIQLWHIFKDIDRTFAREAVNKMANHLWTYRLNHPYLVLCWVRCTEDEQLYVEMARALRNIHLRTYKEALNAETEELEAMSEEVFGEHEALATDLVDDSKFFWCIPHPVCTCSRLSLRRLIFQDSSAVVLTGKRKRLSIPGLD